MNSPVELSSDPMLQRVRCEWIYTEYTELNNGDYIKLEIVPQNQLGETQIILGIIDKELNQIETITGEKVPISFHDEVCLFYKFEIKNKNFVNINELA